MVQHNVRNIFGMPGRTFFPGRTYAETSLGQLVAQDAGGEGGNFATCKGMLALATGSCSWFAFFFFLDTFFFAPAVADLLVFPATSFFAPDVFVLLAFFFARAVADLFVFLGVFSSVASSVWVSPSPHLRFASVRQLSQVTSTQSWTLANRHTSSVSKANLTFRQHESVDPCAITTFWQSGHFWYWARSSKRARRSETNCGIFTERRFRLRRRRAQCLPDPASRLSFSFLVTPLTHQKREWLRTKPFA